MWKQKIGPSNLHYYLFFILAVDPILYAATDTNARKRLSTLRASKVAIRGNMENVDEVKQHPSPIPKGHRVF